MRVFKYIGLVFFFMMSIDGMMATTYTVIAGSTTDLQLKFSADTLSDGDTLYIPAGTYNLTEYLYLSGLKNANSITVLGAGKNSTIIDGGLNYSIFIDATSVNMTGLQIKNSGTYYGCVYVTGSQAVNFPPPPTPAYYSVVNFDDVLIENGQTSGGVYFGDYSYSTSIKNSTFINNTSSSSGGAMYFSDILVGLTIENCLFQGNISTAEGGALYFSATHSSVIMDRCIFKSNISNSDASGNDGEGAAFYVTNIDGSLTFYNNALYSNSGDCAIFLDEAPSNTDTLKMVNNTIALNSAGGIHFHSSFEGIASFNNNIIVDNNSPTDNDVFGEVTLGLRGNHNVVEQKSATVNIIGSNNEIGHNASYFQLSYDSLIHSSASIPYVLAKLPSGSYPALDLYGNRRDTVLSDIGATEVSLDTIAVWTGGARNKDWVDTVNWKNFKSPVADGTGISAYKDIYILDCNSSNYPLVSNTITLTNGGRLDNATLNIASSAIFKNEGSIKVKNLIVNSDSTGTGQYITTGTIAISGTQVYEQELIGGQWNFLCMPKDIVVDSLFATKKFSNDWGDNTADYWISYYNDTVRADQGSVGWQQVAGGSDILKANTGYIVWVDDDLLVTFDFVPGDFTYDLSYYEGVADSTNWGWNLIGNPYSIALGSDEILNNSGNDTITIGGLYWHNGTRYLSRVDGVGLAEHIPAHQAFFVQVDTGLQFSINTSDAVFRDDVVFKSASLNTSSVMTITLSDFSNPEDKTFLRVKERATSSFDAHFDAYELSEFSYSSLSLFSTLGGVDYSVNTIALPEIVQTIPLQVKLPVDAEEFKLTFDLDGFVGIYPYLYDKVDGSSTFIEDGDELYMEVTDNVTSYKSRFEVEFRSLGLVTNNVENVETDTRIRIYSDGDLLYVQSEDEFSPLQIVVFDLLGKEHCNQQIEGGYGTVSGLNSGVYIVKITQGSTVGSYKILL